MNERKPQGRKDPRLPDAAGTYPGDDAPAGTPGTGEDACPECGGSGQIKGEPCANCGGAGTVIKGIAGG